jgi:glucose/arabinose dehydrogenase
MARPLSIVLIVIAVVSFPSFSRAASVNVELVAPGLSQPVGITHAGDGSGRLFITLQAGRIVIFDGASILPTPFLDIQALVSCCGERGLLSVAFHPSYELNGFFYVNYTNIDGNTVIARYSVSGADANVADPNSSAILLTISQPFANHNGGQLQFGPDGYLYIGMGDGGSGGDPFNNAQNLGTLLGKILRIDVDSAFPYAVPAANPFTGNPGAFGEIWALGLRNPWRFSFDRLTGDLFIADVGQNNWEEVNFQSAGSTGGENYGWRLMEGFHCFDPATGCNDGTLTLPILEYDHSTGCSVTGGYAYRGAGVPELYGTYVYADFCTGRISGAVRDQSGAWTSFEILDTDFTISSFGEDEAGEIYFTHHDVDNGAVYRIMSSTSGVSPLTQWNGWFAVDSRETPAVGDFDGDGRTDVITFTRDNPLAVGDVYVALSDGSQFGESTLWNDWFAVSRDEEIVIGDFNGDGLDDAATWLRATTRQVYVVLSNGAGMENASVWIDNTGPNGNDVLKAGDCDGDGRDDLILFAQSAGKVYVARSVGNGFSSPEVWHNFFAVSAQERPEVGDLDGDGRTDIITFCTDNPVAQGDVYIALSTGSQFADGQNSENWSDWFAAAPSEIVRTGDLDGDGRSDLITFLPPPFAQVYAVYSQGSFLSDNLLLAGNFRALSTDTPHAGDVNGDGKADLILFRQSEGRVYVSLSQ